MTPSCATGASVLSIDWTIDLPSYYDALPDNVAVQGNLDPLILSSTPEIVGRKPPDCSKPCRGATATFSISATVSLPSAKPDNMQVLCDTIAEFAS